MATEHCATTLLFKFGLLPWKRLVEMTHENLSRAILHHNSVLLRRCFHPWLKYTREIKEEREKAAESLHNRILLRQTWRQWRKVSSSYVYFITVELIPAKVASISNSWKCEGIFAYDYENSY